MKKSPKKQLMATSGSSPAQSAYCVLASVRYAELAVQRTAIPSPTSAEVGMIVDHVRNILAIIYSAKGTMETTIDHLYPRWLMMTGVTNAHDSNMAP